FEEVERARGHLLAETSGLGDRQAVVVVDAEDELGAELLAGADQELRRPADRLARLEDIVLAAPGGGEEADGGPAAVDQGLRLLDGLVAVLGDRAGGGEGGDELAVLAAEQLVNGHAQRLPLDVVQRDVDG